VTTTVEPQALRDRFTTVGVASLARYLVGVAALAGLYYGSARLGYALRFSGWAATIVWLPGGVAISFVYLRGLRYWPGVLIGDVWAHHHYANVALGTAAGLTLANLLEVLVGALLIHRLVRGGDPLKNVSRLARLWCALAIATLTSAAIGSMSLRLGGLVSADALPELVRTWWLGDFVGTLVVVPLALAWSRPPPANWLRGRSVELTLVLIVVAVLAELALRKQDPLTFLVLPGLIWCALRFGRWGATLAVAEATALIVWNTTHHRPAIEFTSSTQTLLNTQLFIAVCAVSALYLVALVSEREEFAERLGASRTELLHASDSARERIERDLHDGAQQRLIALGMQLSRTAEQPDVGANTRAMLDAAQEDLELALDELRELAHGMNPPTLANLGLERAVRRIAASFDVPVTIHELPTTPLDENVELTAYFVIAEALTNAVKYSGAHEIDVRARLARGWLRVEVADDGVGGAQVRPSGGLSGLRDRVEDAGGNFEVVSGSGRGTRVKAALPLDHPARLPAS
jgi:signal transduction histidine kinase